jgi:hypothetical protein
MHYDYLDSSAWKWIITQGMVLGIWKVPSSSLGPKTAYYETSFSDSSHSVQVYVGVLIKFGYDHFHILFRNHSVSLRCDMQAIESNTK